MQVLPGHAPRLACGPDALPSAAGNTGAVHLLQLHRMQVRAVALQYVLCMLHGSSRLPCQVVQHTLPPTKRLHGVFVKMRQSQQPRQTRRGHQPAMPSRTACAIYLHALHRVTLTVHAAVQCILLAQETGHFAL